MGGWGWSQSSGLGLYSQSQRKAWASEGLFSAGICSLWLRRTFQPSEFQPTSRRVRRQTHSLSLPLARRPACGAVPNPSPPITACVVPRGVPPCWRAAHPSERTNGLLQVLARALPFCLLWKDSCRVSLQPWFDPPFSPFMPPEASIHAGYPSPAPRPSTGVPAPSWLQPSCLF